MSLEDFFDPNNEIIESGTYENYEYNQYEYWEIDSNGTRSLRIISDMDYPTPEHGENEFNTVVDEIKKINYYFEAGMLGECNPGEEKDIYNEEGETIDTEFVEYYIH